jgi:hypothetical protein
MMPERIELVQFSADKIDQLRDDKVNGCRRQLDSRNRERSRPLRALFCQATDFGSITQATPAWRQRFPDRSTCDPSRLYASIMRALMYF